MFGNLPVQSVYEEVGGTVELPCKLDFQHDTETQHWDYYQPPNGISTPFRMVTRWPRDDAESLQDPSPAFTGKWNLTDTFGILLRNITPKMEGYFQCGKSLTNGSEAVDAFNFLHVTTSDTTASYATCRHLYS